MKINLPLYATLAAAPVVTKAWSFATMPYTTMRNGVGCSPNEAMRQQQAMINRAFQNMYGPRYQVDDSDEKFQVALEIPGVKAENVNVQVKQEGNVQVLSVRGEREPFDRSVGSAKFAQEFTLDAEVNVDELVANLQDGILIVSAPKEARPSNTRTVPVMQVKPDQSASATGESVKVDKPSENDASDSDQHDSATNSIE